MFFFYHQNAFVRRCLYRNVLIYIGILYFLTTFGSFVEILFLLGNVDHIDDCCKNWQIAKCDMDTHFIVKLIHKIKWINSICIKSTWGLNCAPFFIACCDQCIPANCKIRYQINISMHHKHLILRIWTNIFEGWVIYSCGQRWWVGSLKMDSSWSVKQVIWYFCF